MCVLVRVSLHGRACGSVRGRASSVEFQAPSVRAFVSRVRLRIYTGLDQYCENEFVESLLESEIYSHLVEEYS